MSCYEFCKLCTIELILILTEYFLYKLSDLENRESPEDRWMLDMIKPEFVENPTLLQENCKYSFK